MKKNRLLEARTSIIFGVLIVLSILFLPLLSSAFDWTGTTAYYKLDTGSGVFANDSTGHNYNGTLINAPNWQGGILGGSLNFTNASLQYINFSGTDDFSVTGNRNFSISVWIYPNSSTDVLVIAGKEANWFIQQNNLKLEAYFLDSVDSAYHNSYVTDNDVLNVGVWQHIVFSYNGTGDASGSSGFFAVNGTVMPTTKNYNEGNNRNNTGNFKIGKHPTSNNRYWKGGIDEFGFWNKALTRTDVIDLYNSGTGITYEPPAPSINITLTAPSDASTLTATNNNFTAYYNASSMSYNLSNATYFIWYSNGTVWNNTYVSAFTNTKDSSSTEVFALTTLGDYVWNTYVCIGNGAVGNCSFADNNFSFSYKPFTIDGEYYLTPVVRSSSQNFYLNISLSSGFQLSSANLVYNGTNYPGTANLISSGSYQLSRTITVPTVTADTNYTFYWNITMEDGTLVNSTLHNQTVVTIALDDCSVYTVQILNLTLINEESQAWLVGASDNTSIKVDIDIYPTQTSTTPVIEYYHFYNQTNPARVCSSVNLSNSTFFMDVNINYDADTYASEYYNIQRYNLNGTSGAYQNIYLFDLSDTKAQSFKISYKDSSYLPVQDALINIQRKYISEGIFKTVEIPKTDAYGETVGNLVVNDEIYNFVVSKNGVILGIFNNIRVVCQNPTIYECAINLNSFSSSIPISNFTKTNDFYYTITLNKTSRVVTATFTVLSGSVSNVVLNVSSANALATSICSETLLSSGGSLTCTIPSSFGNSTAIIRLYKDGSLVGFSQVNLTREPSDLYGGFAVFLAIFIILTFIGVAMSDNPVYTVIALIVGVILLFALNIVSHNGFIGAGATILFLIIAVILVIIKGSKRQ